MTELVEGVTHIAAIVFYAAAFIMAFIAHCYARLWARRISTAGIMMVAAGWLVFYVFISNLTFAEVHTSVLWSRVFHYNTATWLFIMAFVIRRSEKYGVELALSRGADD